jgi:hypothetical protein
MPDTAHPHLCAEHVRQFTGTEIWFRQSPTPSTLPRQAVHTGLSMILPSPNVTIPLSPRSPSSFGPCESISASQPPA